MAPAQSKPYAELELRASKTIGNHNQGKKNWNDFAKVQEVPLFDEWTNDMVSENNGVAFQTRFREFAFYLTDKKADGTHYSVDSQMQYLSNAKAAFVAKFKSEVGRVPDILDERSEWYKDLRVSVLSCTVDFFVGYILIDLDARHHWDHVLVLLPSAAGIAYLIALSEFGGSCFFASPRNCINVEHLKET
jgi:hypothetical protein